MSNYHLRVEDMMQTEVVTILGDATIQEAAALMRYEGVRSLLIEPRDGSGRYGIITFSDIIKKVLAERRDPRRVTVDEVGIPQAKTVVSTADVQAVSQFFREHNLGHAPVLDESGQLVGVISMTDLITEVITEPE